MNHQDDWAGVEFCETSPLSAASLHVEALATGWSNQLARQLDIDLQTIEVQPLPIECLSIRLQSKLPATVGFAFPDAIEFVVPDAIAAKSDKAPWSNQRQHGADLPAKGVS